MAVDTDKIYTTVAGENFKIVSYWGDKDPQTREPITVFKLKKIDGHSLHFFKRNIAFADFERRVEKKIPDFSKVSKFWPCRVSLG